MNNLSRNAGAVARRNEATEFAKRCFRLQLGNRTREYLDDVLDETIESLSIGADLVGKLVVIACGRYMREWAQREETYLPLFELDWRDIADSEQGDRMELWRLARYMDERLVGANAGRASDISRGVLLWARPHNPDDPTAHQAHEGAVNTLSRAWREVVQTDEVRYGAIPDEVVWYLLGPRIFDQLPASARNFRRGRNMSERVEIRRRLARLGAALLVGGYSVNAVAEMFQVSRQTLWSWMREYDMTDK